MSLTDETLRRVQGVLATMGVRSAAQLEGVYAELRKATFAAPSTPTTGINNYNLERLVKLLFNAFTPLRNIIPRKQSPNGGSATNWVEINAINTGKNPMGLPDGFRGAETSHTVSRRTESYIEIGSETSTTFLAQLVAMGFDSPRALQQVTGLRQTQINEERYLLGGLGTYGLGITPTVVIATSATAGSLSTSTTYHVRCVALTMEGLRLSTAPTSVLGGALATVRVMTEAGPRGRTFNVNGGAAQVSADASLSTSSGTSLDCTVPAVVGAAAYAWFIGSSSTNGTLAAITSVNAVNLKSVPTIFSPLANGDKGDVGTNFGSDRSQNALVFDGIISTIARSGSGAQVTTLDGGTLTGDGAGGIVEFDTVLQAMATNFNVTVEDIWVNYEQIPDITSRIMSGGSGPQLYHIVVPEGAGQGSVQGGVVVNGYNNKFALDPSHQMVNVRKHPDVPPGMVLFTSQSLPPIAFPDANIGGILEVETLEEYTQREWPLTTRLYESGVYVTEVLKCYAPFALGMLHCVGKG